MHRREMVLIEHTFRQALDQVAAQEPNLTKEARLRRNTIEGMARNLGEAFKLDNPSFRTDLFLKGCGVRETSGVF